MVNLIKLLSSLLTILMTGYFSEQNSKEKRMETVVKGPISTDNIARGKRNLQLGGEAHYFIKCIFIAAMCWPLNVILTVN